jgi:hypothetical protein
VALVELWLVISPHSAGNDACLRPDVPVCIRIPQRRVSQMLRSHAQQGRAALVLNVTTSYGSEAPGERSPRWAAREPIGMFCNPEEP